MKKTKNIEKKEFSPEENAIIYDEIERSQIATHFLSTNQRPTVENVEALLVKTMKLYKIYKKFTYL